MAAAPIANGWARFWGSPTLIASLQGVLAHRRLPPALLLSGPASTGKALLAELLAQALLCTAAAAPCGTCRSCLTVTRREHPDCVWLEPESPTTAIAIETVRELLDQLHHTPVQGAVHVGIVINVEQLSDDAATTLLKTLEEPSPSAHLILTTQDPGRCLPTIVSRCHLLRVAPLDRAALAERLTRERGVPADTAQRVAALADGRVGQALQLLETDTAATAWRELLESPRDWSADRRDEIYAALEHYVRWCRDRVCAQAGCEELVTSADADTASLDSAGERLDEALQLLEALERRVNPKLLQWRLQQRWAAAPQPS